MTTTSEMSLDEVSIDFQQSAAAPVTQSWLRRNKATLSGIGFSIGLFSVSRLLVTISIYFGQVLVPGRSMSQSLLSWDSGWYYGVVARGYPHVAYDPNIPNSAANTIAFFPFYPILVRALHDALPITILQAGIAVSLISGAIAASFIWLIARQLCGAKTANKSVALFSFFPGSVALMLMMSEGTMLALAAGCIYFLMNKRWLWAGAFAALATATRPTAGVLVLCCAWACAVAIWKDRDLKSLVAPILAPFGTLAYFAFLWHHTGNFWAWNLVEDKGWGIGDLGHLYAFKAFHVFFINPLADLNASATVFGVVMAAMSVVFFALWKRPPITMVLFVAGLIALGIFSGGWGSKIRYMFCAFPVAIAAARWAKDDVRFMTLFSVSSMSLALYAVLETQTSISIL